MSIYFIIDHALLCQRLVAFLTLVLQQLQSLELRGLLVLLLRLPLLLRLLLLLLQQWTLARTAWLLWRFICLEAVVGRGCLKMLLLAAVNLLRVLAFMVVMRQHMSQRSGVGSLVPASVSVVSARCGGGGDCICFTSANLFLQVPLMHSLQLLLLTEATLVVARPRLLRAVSLEAVARPPRLLQAVALAWP